MLRKGVWLSEAHLLELCKVDRALYSVQKLVELEVLEAHLAQLCVGVLSEDLRDALEDALGHDLRLQVQRSQLLVVHVRVVRVLPVLFLQQSVVLLAPHAHLLLQRAFERALVLYARTREPPPQQAREQQAGAPSCS